jgi:hypothetical protein
MRIAFWSVAMAIAVGGVFLSESVLPNDGEKALAPSRTIAEGPPYAQPRGWSCDGSNWIFFDRECSRRRRHKHHHHPVIAADGKDSVEPLRESASASESLPAPVKPVHISLNGESAAKPKAKIDARGSQGEHRQASQPRTARLGEPPRIPPAVYGYYAYVIRPHGHRKPVWVNCRTISDSVVLAYLDVPSPTSVVAGPAPSRPRSFPILSAAGRERMSPDSEAAGRSSSTGSRSFCAASARRFSAAQGAGADRSTGRAVWLEREHGGCGSRDAGD